MENLVQVISNPLNLRILTLLRGSPMYPRQIALLTGKNEALVSRHLRMLEKAGLIKGEWTRVAGRNVKIYKLRVSEISIKILPGGLSISLGDSATSMGMGGFSNPVPRVSAFVGREELVSRILRGRGVFFISGGPGMGKTYLAARIAHLSSRPTAWVYLKPTDMLEAVVLRIIMVLGQYCDADVGDPEETAVACAEKSRALVVLDDYHNRGDPRIDRFVEYFDKNAEKGLMLVLSRSTPPMEIPYNKYVVVPPFKAGEVSRLAHVLGVQLGAGDLERVMAVTYGNPLLTRTVLELLKSGIGLEEIVRDSRLLEVSYRLLARNLGERERELIMLLSAFREPVPISVVSGFYGRGWRHALRRLEKAGIVMVSGNTASVHELLKTYFAETRDLSKYHIVAAEYYESMGGYDGLMEALYHRLVGGDWEGAMRLALEIHKNWFELRIMSFRHMRRLLEAVDPRSLSPVSRAVYWVLMKKVTRSSLGKIECLKRALRASEEALDPELVAWVLGQLAYVLLPEGRVEEARRCAERGLEELRKVRKASFPNAYSTIGVSFILLEQPDKAEEVLNLSLERFGERELIETMVVSMRASIYYVRGLMDKYVEALEESFSLHVSRGDLYGAISNLHDKVVSLVIMGRTADAERDLARLWELAEKRGDPDSIATAHYAEAHVRAALGNFPAVKEHVGEIRRIEEEENYSFWSPGGVAVLEGLCLAAGGEVEKGLEEVKKGLRLIRSRRDRFITQAFVSHILLARGIDGGFRDLWEEAVKELRSLGLRGLWVMSPPWQLAGQSSPGSKTQ